VAGLHRSPYRGFSIEFAEHREYAPGDDLRYVDWKVFGRTDKFYLKQYEDETNLICYLVLDISESMRYQGPDAALSKLEYAQCLAAAMAWLVLHQQDAVGLVTFDNEIRANVAPSSNASHLRSLLQVMEDVHPVAKTATGPIFHELAERFRKRGVVLILSDLFDEVGSLMAGLKHFAHRRHDVILLHVLDPAELEFPFRSPTMFHGLEQYPELLADPRSLRRSLSARDGAVPHRGAKGLSAPADGLPTDPHRSTIRRSPDQVPGRTQAFETGPASEDVVDVQQQAGVGMVALDGDHRRLADRAQRLRRSPDLQLGHHAHFAAQFEHRAIALGDLAQVHAGNLVDARGGRCDPFAADLGDQIHVTTKLVHRLLAACVVVDGPGGKSDGAFDGQPRIGDLFAQVCQRMPVFDMPSQVRIHGSMPEYPASAATWTSSRAVSFWPMMVPVFRQ
jgi:hypothetical protein